jgi:hypothetical protein
MYPDTFQNVFACDSIVITTLDTTTYCIWPTEIIYVDSLATGDNTGFDWDNAYTDLQLGLDVAGRYQNARQIWVAQGTYFPTAADHRMTSFTLPDSTYVLGGFLGIETDSADRNADLYPTSLSGDIGVPDDPMDNSYHVVVNPASSAGVLLDGFNIRHGNADGVDVLDKSGAGISNFGILRLANCRIAQCTSTGLGALVFNSGPGAHLTLEDVTAIGMISSQIWNTDQAAMHLIGLLQTE